jgi:hypothetical protein
MGKDPHIQFLKLIHEIFDPVFLKYGFAIQEEELWIQPEETVFARKGDIELQFRLGSSQLFWYFSTGIKLSGKLADEATSDPSYHGLEFTAIAECLDPSYRRNLKAAQTEAELREQMERDKMELLKYCDNILLDDVSNWQKVVDCLKRKSID